MQGSEIRMFGVLGGVLVVLLTMLGVLAVVASTPARSFSVRRR